MKNKIILFICILFVPIVIDSLMYNNYYTTLNNVNEYINYFDNYDIYIEQGNIPYKYENNILEQDDNFINGGLLNLMEFINSKDTSGNTYLFNGMNYWTMTSLSDKKYIISFNPANKYELYDLSQTATIRPCVYVKSNINVNGIGTYLDPWKFITPNYSITINLTNATINNKYTFNDVIHYTNANYSLTPDEYYISDSNTISCTNSIGTIKNNNLTLNNISGDVVCNIEYKPKTFIATLSIENASFSDDSNSVSINANALQDLDVSLVPNEYCAYNYVSCTNGQKYSYNNKTFTIKGITADTSCNIVYQEIKEIFLYSEDTQTFVVPATGYYTIDAYGAQGGNKSSTVVGGNGGRIKVKVYLEKDTTLLLDTGGIDGHNGGGSKVGSTSYVGGGSTTIKIGTKYISIAGGGGGAGNNNSNGGLGGIDNSSSGNGGESVGGNSGFNGTNGGGGSSSVDYSKTTCNSCPSETCQTCSESCNCTTTYKNGDCLKYDQTQGCIVAGDCKCTKYRQVPVKTCQTCSKSCNCVTTYYDCECSSTDVLGKPGYGGKNSASSDTETLIQESGNNSGNGYIVILFSGE